MNKQRRKRLDQLATSLDDAIAELTEIHDEEEEALDNLPDSLRESDRGQEIEDAFDSLETALTDLESVATEIRGLSET